MKIILGSSSKYRKALLEDRGYVFEVVSPDIDEKTVRTDDYYQLSLLLAQAKSKAVLEKITQKALVIAADVVVVYEGRLYEKPKDAEETRQFLKDYGNGSPIDVVSALVVVNTQNQKKAEGTDIAKVYYRSMPDNIIEDFIKNGDPFTKAGGFSIQSSILKPYLQKIEGTIDSVMGMPLSLLEKLIQEVT